MVLVIVGFIRLSAAVGGLRGLRRGGFIVGFVTVNVSRAAGLRAACGVAVVGLGGTGVL